jgi:hypothetical protein
VLHARPVVRIDQHVYMLTCLAHHPPAPSGKFILFQMERARAAGVDGAALEARLSAADFSSQAAVDALPLAERWIVTRVHQVRTTCMIC